MQIHLKALGCRLNEAEIENWAADFQSQGHNLTEQPDNADLIVINTCAVTNEAVKKSRQLIRRSHRNNPKAKLVVSGCYASLNPELEKDIPAIDMLVANHDKDKLVERVNQELALEAMPGIATEPEEAALFKRGRNRAFIKIQDGCRYRCTFCIVTVARGAERSIKLRDITTQINKLHDQGIKEVVLTGVHVGGYGSDIGSDLYSLINTILLDTDIPRLRLASIEPWDLPDNFYDLFENPRLMPHIHLPLQSGSDAILKRMARRCKTNDFKQLVMKARSEVDDFNVTTDIIVGFPGESEYEWQKSLDFIEEIGFSHIHIFPYSPRSGTRAADMDEQVSAVIKKARCQQLHLLANKIRTEFLQKQINKEFPVLFEGTYTAGKDIASGYTTNFLRVQLPLTDELSVENDIKKVRISALTQDNDGLLAELTNTI